MNYHVGTVDFVHKRFGSAIKRLELCWLLLSHMRNARDKTMQSWKKIDLEILTSLCVLSPPDYEKVVSGVPSV
jgi:hypothetical protein